MNSSYTCHSMTPDDYDGVMALWRRTSAEALSGADSRENIARYLARNPGQSLLCRAAGGAVVGAILCGNDGRRAYIHHAAVAPEHRRRGIAAELTERALAIQYGLGMRKCHIFVFADNDGAAAFWRRQGFIMRGDLTVMSRALVPRPPDMSG